MSTSTPVSRRSLSLLWKTLAAMLVAAVMPLALISALALKGYADTSDHVSTSSQQQLRQAAEQALQQRATQTATEISRFLDGRVQDTLTLALLSPTTEAYTLFSQAHQRELWLSDGTPEGQRVELPIYRELAFITVDGRELLRIRDGRPVPTAELRTVAIPTNTTYRSETYFRDARALTPGQVWVSHVTAWHSSQPQQPATSSTGSDAERYRSYEALIRFATPVAAQQGRPAGVVVLSLDHRHVMDYVLHLQTTGDKTDQLWVDYASGNYATLFDEQGYVIAHPKLVRVRGLDSNGNLLPPAASDQQAEHLPLNYAQTGWMHQNFSAAYKQVLLGNSGVISITNVMHVERVVAYAPIWFQAGAGTQRSIFGGLMLGANLREMIAVTNSISTQIAEEQRQFRGALAVGIALVVLLVLGVTWLISRRITRPIRSLTEVATLMERGELDATTLKDLYERGLEDEVSRLARVFKQMAQKVQLRERSLKQEISRLHIEIDMRKQERQVAEITESDFFRNLQGRAQHLRARARGLAEQLDADETPPLGATGSAD